jgi:DNA-binding NarL/FixJ family response regulator
MVLGVGVADDNVLIREALTSIVAASAHLELAAVCADADELRAAVDHQGLDVVVTEIRLPPTMTDDGIRLAVELRETHPDVGVVVLSTHCDPQSAIRLLEAGSNGRAYLLKDRLHDTEQLVATITEVSRGGSVIDPKVVEALVNGDQAVRTRPWLAALTVRERQILAEMARGASNQGIAETLHLTKRAVEKGINAIFAKLELPPTPDVSRRVLAVLLFLVDGPAGAGPMAFDASPPASGLR